MMTGKTNTMILDIQTYYGGEKMWSPGRSFGRYIILLLLLLLFAENDTAEKSRLYCRLNGPKLENN